MSAQNHHCCTEHQGRRAWRHALATLASPMVRLHQLRNVRSQMLREVLDEHDHCESREHDA